MGTKEKRLRKARKAKSHASHVLGLIESGQLSLTAVLEDFPDPVHRWTQQIGHVRIHTVMVRAPGLGEKGVKQTLFKAKIYSHTRLRDLSQVEVERIIESLPPRAR